MEPRARCSSRGVPAADAHGQHHGGGHAQPGAWGLDQGGDRPGHIDGGQPGIAHALAHEHPVHDGVDAGEGKGDDGGEHIAPEISLDHERGLLRLRKTGADVIRKRERPRAFSQKIRVFLCLKQKCPIPNYIYSAESGKKSRNILTKH